ncbi:MAG TPA: hypothetical protein VMT60_00445 [Candidatus Bathyarchaeia archaeon]|nr:hypothetical protein [Candidatus Bathyarchaeia archaeon]
MGFLNRISWKVALGVSLIILSAILYSIHYLIFGDARHIFLYFLGDLAFLPIEVFFVTIVITQLLSEREKRTLLKKLNMVIGAFFSEVGTRLLKEFVRVDTDAAEKRERIAAPAAWRGVRINELAKFFRSCEYRTEPAAEDLACLKAFLTGKREFMLGLLENPNLLEHESFTEMLWAVFHLTEELDAREDFSNLPVSDVAHIKGDLKRAYTAITVEWLFYMDHLRQSYPYLFSLAVRTNPFDPAASVIVT